MYHFCECPNHKGGIHWHVHSRNDCRTLCNWLKQQGKEFTLTSSPGTATVATDAETATSLMTDAPSDNASQSNNSQDISTLTDTNTVLGLLAQGDWVNHRFCNFSYIFGGNVLVFELIWYTL